MDPSEKEATEITLVSARVLVLVTLNPGKELLHAALLKDSHKWGGESLRFGGGDFGNLAAAVHKGARNLLELEIFGHIRVGQELDNLAIGHHKLGNQVNVPVAILAQVLGGRLTGKEFVIQL